MLNFLSKLRWTSYKIENYQGTEYETERYYGFYLSASPCAVGGISSGLWNRHVRLTFSWGLKDIVAFDL